MMVDDGDGGERTMTTSDVCGEIEIEMREMGHRAQHCGRKDAVRQPHTVVFV